MQALDYPLASAFHHNRLSSGDRFSRRQNHNNKLFQDDSSTAAAWPNLVVDRVLGSLRQLHNHASDYGWSGRGCCLVQAYRQTGRTDGHPRRHRGIVLLRTTKTGEIQGCISLILNAA